MEREKIEKILQRKVSTKFNFYQQTVLFLEPTYGCLCQNFLPITSLFYCQACMGIKCRLVDDHFEFTNNKETSRIIYSQIFINI